MLRIVRLGLFTIFATFSSFAHAIRPFVTDDARIVDFGQIEMENWVDTTRADGKWDPAPGINGIASTSVNDWLQILAGAGTGIDASGRSGIANPLLSAKVLFKHTAEGGQPGFAVSYTSTFDSGSGSFQEPGRVASLAGMTTHRLFEDKLLIHLNFGTRTDRPREGETRTRPLWGVGFDTEVFSPKTRVVVEAFSGDPLALNAPRYATQVGLRYLHSDYMQMDFIWGAEPQLDEQLNRTGRYEQTLQIGVRLLFDAFTRDGKPGNPDGARGLFH